jgi:hypothetical protein
MPPLAALRAAVSPRFALRARGGDRRGSDLDAGGPERSSGAARGRRLATRLVVALSEPGPERIWRGLQDTREHRRAVWFESECAPLRAVREQCACSRRNRNATLSPLRVHPSAPRLGSRGTGEAPLLGVDTGTHRAPAPRDRARLQPSSLHVRMTRPLVLRIYSSRGVSHNATVCRLCGTLTATTVPRGSRMIAMSCENVAGARYFRMACSIHCVNPSGSVTEEIPVATLIPAVGSRPSEMPTSKHPPSLFANCAMSRHVSR